MWPMGVGGGGDSRVALRRPRQRQAPSTVASSEEAATTRGQPVPLPAEVAAVTTLLPRVVTATAVVLITFAAIRGPNPTNKNWDKAMFVVAGLLAALCCVYFLTRPARRAASVTAACAAGALLLGIARLERQSEHVTIGGVDIRLPHLFWEGFGPPVAIGALILAVVLWRSLDRLQTSGPLRAVLMTGIAVVCVGDLASLVRTFSDFAEPVNNVFLLNEVLAPAAGKVPDATFVPQYISLYGWLLVPLRHLMSARDLVQVATIFMSSLAILSVVFAVVIAYRSMSSPRLWFAAGIVIPLTCVTVLHDHTPYFASSIASYMQELPTRMFPTMLYSLLGLEEITRIRNGKVRNWRLFALGALAGLIVWNSQDFGIAVTLAYGILLAVAVPTGRVRRSMLRWAGGLLVGLAVYPAATQLAGTPIQWTDFGLFSRAFANGYAAAPIQVPGPVLVVFPLLLSSASVGLALLWRQRRRPPGAAATSDRAILTLALVGTWGTGGFVYYLGRSYASGQLQVLLMPCGVCIVALASLAHDARQSMATGEPARRRLRPSAISFGLVPVALLAALGLASILQSPNPVTVANGLTNAPPNYGFGSQTMPPSVLQAAETYVQSQGGGTIGYFGNNGNYVHLSMGLPNISLVDDPVQFLASPLLRAKGCRYLADHATKWLLTYEPPSVQGLGQLDVCFLYDLVSTPALPAGTLYVRNNGGP
jgi:hypothetical protein